jgi:subtilase family serine protease
MAVDGTGKALVAALESFPWGPAYRSVPVDLPDLIVSSFASSFSADNPPKYVVEFKVRNIGTAASGATTTYIDAINLAPPLGQNEIRIQNQAALPGLEPGQETPVIRTAFDLANIFAKEVRLMRITVDPKNLVDEAFETNNQAERAWP